MADKYLGKPKSAKGTTWRYGSNQGSLAVTVNGAKKGCWYDFQTGEGGDMLGLIKHVTQIQDFKELCTEANRFLGRTSDYQAKPSLIRKAPQIDETVLLREKHEKAKQVCKGSMTIKNTLAERYLREHRGINQPLREEVFAYHPKLKNWMNQKESPALLIKALDDQKNICGVQAIFLDPKTANKSKAGPAKLSRGQIGKGALVHQGNSEKVALAEGLETALSVAEARPDWSVYVTFGVSNFEKVALETKAKEIIICADNDGPNSGTEKAVQKAAEKLSEKDIKVLAAEPSKPDRIQKWDFNDALLKQGIEQVKKDLDALKPYKWEKDRKFRELEIEID